MYIKFPKEQREQIKDRIRQYFMDEKGEEMGDLAAENFLDFITKEIGPVYYNQALSDAQKTVDERIANIEEDLLSLKRPIE